MRWRLLAAAASGGLVALAFPAPGWWPLAFVALAPLLVAIDGLGPRRAALFGLVHGVAFYLVCLRWLAGLTLWGWVTLAVYLALYTALFAAGAAALAAARSRWATALVPAVWVGCEWLRSWLLGGFGWAALGFALAPAPRLIQVAAWGGVPLLSLALIGSNCALARAWPHLRGRAWRPAAPVLAAAAAVPLLLLIQGSVALATAADDGGQLRVAVIQGDIDPREKWEERGMYTAMQRYPALSQQAAAEHPALILWPETAVPTPMDDASPMALYAQRLRDGVNAWRAALIIGIPEPAPGGRFYNSARLYPRTGVPPPTYRKRRLVPFGEYTPTTPPLSWVPKVVPGPQIAFGDGGGPFTVDGVRVGVIICFETVFATEVVARAADADLLAVITNDGWFGPNGSAQHFDIAVLRAVETGRAVARAANTGISALIDPHGRVLARAPDGPSFAVGDLPLSRRTTPFARAPDLLPLACVAAVLAGLAAHWLRRRSLRGR